MQRMFSVFLSAAVVMSSSLLAQTSVPVAAYVVAYVELSPGPGAVAALKAYRDASKKEDGCVGLELFEQIGRPGHFAAIETWKDQAALDAHGTAAHTRQFAETLRPLRLSDYDQRPYKTLSVTLNVGAAPASIDNQAIYVITHVDTVPAPQSDGPGLLRRLAETSRKEPGNLRFDVVQHAMRGNHFTIVEAWQSQKALDQHAAAADTRQYRDALQPISGSPLDERVYKAVR